MDSWVVTWLYIVWSIVPVLIAIAVLVQQRASSRSTWQGFSLRWWFTDAGSLAKSDDLQLALMNSLVLAVLTIVVAVPLGIALAIGLVALAGRARRRRRTG